jgi:hypothetical protein
MVPECYSHSRSVTDLRPPRAGVVPSRLACGHQPLPRRSHATLGACWALPLTLTQLHKCANACRSDSLEGTSGRCRGRRARTWAPVITPARRVSRRGRPGAARNGLCPRGMRSPLLAVGDAALGFWARCGRCSRRPRGPVMVPQDRECPSRAAHVRSPGSQEGPGRDLGRRGQGPRPGGGEGVRGRLRGQVPQRRSRRSPMTSRSCGRSATTPPSIGSARGPPTRCRARVAISLIRLVASVSVVHEPPPSIPQAGRYWLRPGCTGDSPVNPRRRECCTFVSRAHRRGSPTRSPAS